MGEHGGYEPLAEGVVERVVNHLRDDAQPCSGAAINRQQGLQPLILLIAAHVAKFGEHPERLDELRRPGIQFSGVGIFEAVLVLRPAHAILDGEVLHRLQVQGDVVDLRQFLLQTPDDLAGGEVPLRERREVDEDAPAVERGVGAVHPDERRQAFDRRILENHRRQSLLARRHPRE